MQADNNAGKFKIKLMGETHFLSEDTVDFLYEYICLVEKAEKIGIKGEIGKK